MAAPVNRLEHSVLKIVLWSIGLLVLLIAAGLIGPRVYHKWQERHLVRQGNQLLAAGDYKRASLAARRVIQLNDKNVEACRLIAKLSEHAGLKTAVDWRQRVVDLTGPNPPDLLALAKDAIQFGDLPKAESALARMPEKGKSTADYHAIAADMAAAQNDPAAVERHLSEAVRLAPADKTYQIRLASVQLASADSTTREKGRLALIELQKDPALAREATKQLLAAAVQRYDSSRTTALAQQLLAFSDATFADRLAALDALHRGFEPAFGPLFQKMKDEAANDAAKAGQLLTWMNTNQMAADAVAWSESLPPEILTHRPVALALADSYTMNRNWDAMLKFLKTSTWGELDFVRQALIARALRETGHQLDSENQWNIAVKATGSKPGTLLMLAEIVQRWNWSAEAIDLLWLVAKDRSKGDGALLSLYSYFSKEGDTQNLYRVLLHLQDFRPDDRKIQNNVAQISLLLNLDVDRAQKSAQELYQAEPTNTAFASTYAFALFQRGDAKKAAGVLRKLPPAELRQPAVAAYYGIILAALGERQEAAEYLALAKTAELLPEERALVEKAQRAIGAEARP